jgi:hypothetical protein
MPLEYVPGSASKDILYQKLLDLKKNSLEDAEYMYDTIRKKINLLEVSQDVAITLDELLLQATLSIKNLHDLFVELINVTDTASNILNRSIVSCHFISENLNRLSEFLDRIGERNISSKLKEIIIINEVNESFLKHLKYKKNRSVNQSRKRNRSVNQSRKRNRSVNQSRKRNRSVNQSRKRSHI